MREGTIRHNGRGRGSSFHEQQELQGQGKRGNDVSCEPRDRRREGESWIHHPRGGLRNSWYLHNGVTMKEKALIRGKAFPIVDSEGNLVSNIDTDMIFHNN